MTSNELKIFKQSILDDVRVMMQTTGQVTQYIGARYVPLFAEPIDWSAEREYEPLTIVLDHGNSFTSRQFVPRGVDISDESFWANTGNYNAQIEQYRQEVKNYKNEVDELSKKVYKAYNNVALMQADSTLSKNMFVITLGYYSEGDGGGACYMIEQNGTETVDTVKLSNGLFAKLIPLGGFVSPEQLGAYGDGKPHIIGMEDIEYNALSFAVDNYPNVVANGIYSISKTLSIAKTRLNLKLNVLKSTANYALSIGNNTFGCNLDFNLVEGENNGVILETDKICGRMNCRLGTITAKKGVAFNGAGGPGGILDCFFSGQVWEGTTCGISMKPTTSFIGNITFDAIRFTATDEGATQIILDSTTGSLTQLHFPDCSAEPQPGTTSNNGILVNVVNSIEFIDGYFRTTELTGKSGYILKIKGNIQQQLSEGMHFTFDHVTMGKIDVSEVNMTRYYALDSPICIIDCNKIVFANQPQTTRVCVYGNKKHCQPLRGRYALCSGDYNWTFDKQIATAIEFNANGTLNIPEWFNPDTDVLFVNAASHTVTVKIDEYGTKETIDTLNDAGWVMIAFYRDNNNVLKMIKK